jgi:hypothetical protein
LCHCRRRSPCYPPPSLTSSHPAAGLIMLSITYLLVDVYKVWSGASSLPLPPPLPDAFAILSCDFQLGFPFRHMGMNSILLYVGHSLLGGYFPFRLTPLSLLLSSSVTKNSSYKTDSASHSRQLQMNCIGVLSWAAVGYYCYLKKFFVKI